MKHICCIILCFCTSIGSYAQNFADYFQNKTLRVDYSFTGDATQQAIYLDEQGVNIISPNFPWKATDKLL